MNTITKTNASQTTQMKICYKTTNFASTLILSFPCIRSNFTINFAVYVHVLANISYVIKVLTPFDLF